jgi:hypothetical protein
MYNLFLKSKKSLFQDRGVAGSGAITYGTERGSKDETSK